MPTRFVYHERLRNSPWPTLFKVLGATLYGTTDVIPSRERVDRFEKYLMEGDEPADAVARELFLSGRPPKDGYRMLHRALEPGGEAGEDLPESLRRLLRQAHTDPGWLDRERVEAGARVCRRLGGWAMSVLGDLALCGGYANPDITKPLVFTGALMGEKTFDRVSETSQFWVDVTRPGAMVPGAKGFQSAVRVRLMHAVVRQRLLHHKDWNSADWGWPINEADSLATNVGFSMAMVYGCKMLGFRLSRKDIEAVLHLWRYIGYLMGDDPDWLPKTPAEGLQCLLLINLSNHNTPDADSRALAMDYLMNFKPDRGKVSGREYWRLYFHFMKHRAYARYLIPPDLYHKLDPPGSYGTWLLVPFVQFPVLFALDRIRPFLPALDGFMERHGARAQESIIEERMGERQAEYVPTATMQR